MKTFTVQEGLREKIKELELELSECNVTKAKCNIETDETVTFDLGILPEFVWRENRIEDIKSAMDRYFKNNREIPSYWIDEYNELMKWRIEYIGKSD